MTPQRHMVMAAAMAVMTCYGPAMASEDALRSYDRAFFDGFSPQSALEMIERLPGFALVEADADRGLSQGGTNVLLNGRPITGKGGAATTQMAQISADSVLRIEILDAGTLDIPGFSGPVANIVTQQTSVTGSVLWEPEFKAREAATLGNGTLSLSGSLENVDLSLALTGTSVRITFDGPETLSTPDTTVFETRDEALSIRGDEPSLSGTLGWDRPNGHALNAKAALTVLNLNRRQTTQSVARTPRGFDGLTIATFGQDRSDYQLDADYTFPAFRGALKLIGVAGFEQDESVSQVGITDPLGMRLAAQRFDEESTSKETIARVEQSWSARADRSWQLAGETAFNALDLTTQLAVSNANTPAAQQTPVVSKTEVDEWRSELTLAHTRRLSSKSDLQVSVGAEHSTLTLGAVERRFLRPKGFVTYTMRPATDWTVTLRAAREVGQIDFRNFAASVSLFEDVATDNNPDLVPPQSWLVSGRTERRFNAGHVASLEVEHEIISDLIDRIPVGDTGDAIGNLPNATQTRLEGALTLFGTPFGIDGTRLDLRGTWQWSAVDDPIEGFERDINGLRTRDLRAEFRHDIQNTPWSYGFTLQDLALAPVFQSGLVQTRNVPPGGLTPGENTVFIEHKDLFGLRVKLEAAEVFSQKSNFTRTLYSGRRDVSPIDRIEDRARSLGGPYLTVSIGRTF